MKLNLTIPETTQDVEVRRVDVNLDQRSLLVRLMDGQNMRFNLTEPEYDSIQSIVSSKLGQAETVNRVDIESFIKPNKEDKIKEDSLENAE